MALGMTLTNLNHLDFALEARTVIDALMSLALDRREFNEPVRITLKAVQEELDLATKSSAPANDFVSSLANMTSLGSPESYSLIRELSGSSDNDRRAMIERIDRVLNSKGPTVDQADLRDLARFFSDLESSAILKHKSASRQGMSIPA
jgi:hypothetical protein